MKSLIAFISALMLGLNPAFAQTWTGPDPERRPSRFGQGDIDFVLSELCFPFILQNASAEDLVRQHRLPRGFGPRDWAGGQPFYLVGKADVWVSFNFTPIERTCSVSIQSGDVARYRETIETRLATWPAPLALSTAPQPLGAYRQRLLYCAAPGGENDAVLISLEGRGIAVMITVGRFATRPPQCDPPPATETSP